jgi:glycosyltransferase involved in cell wall biosynthesis
MQNDRDVAVSVVIPSYNASPSICNCVDSILRQQAEFAFEIIVVDSSEDDTAALLNRRYPQVTVIRSQKRLYPGEARNIGIKAARASIIAFIDADCVACDHWLETICSRHESGYAAIGGSIANGNPGGTLGWAEYFLEFTEFLPSSPVREVRTMPTCNISYKKSDAFGQFGFFPSLRTAEDTHFNWILVKNGKRLLFDPSIRIAHICNRTIGRFLMNQKALGAGFWESRSESKMPGSAAARYLWPLLPFARLFLIARRISVWNPGMLPDFVKSLPFLILGLVAWQHGFVRAHFFGRHSGDF